jgi:hypothetical protein
MYRRAMDGFGGIHHEASLKEDGQVGPKLLNMEVGTRRFGETLGRYSREI